MKNWLYLEVYEYWLIQKVIGSFMIKKIRKSDQKSDQIIWKFTILKGFMSLWGVSVCFNLLWSALWKVKSNNFFPKNVRIFHQNVKKATYEQKRSNNEYHRFLDKSNHFLSLKDQYFSSSADFNYSMRLVKRFYL